MMLPDELEWVLEMLGYRWPTADEDKLRESAQLWRQFGDDVTQLHTAANTSARTVTAHNAGESIDAFTKVYAKFDGGSGGDGYLADAAQAAHIIAGVMDACAYLVEFAKWAVIAQLIALAIEIAAAQLAAPFTFGLSEVGALGATQATRLIVRRLLDELKEALMEAIVEAMKEPAVSAIEAIITDLVRQSVNVGFGAQQGYDLSQTAKAGAQGGWEAIKQTPQTLVEGVRDSLGSKAGNSAHHAIDSRINGYGNSSSQTPGSGGTGSSDSSGSSSGSSGSADSSGSSGSNSSSSSTRSGIGSGISADTGAATVGAPDIGSGPDSGSGTDSGQSTGSSDTSYPRPTPSSTGPTLSDFDDPSPGTTATSTPGSSSTAGSSGTSHTGGGSSVSGLSSPTPHSAPAPTTSGGSVSSSSGNGGGISTNIDSLAASVPTQHATTPTPTPTPTADPSPAGTGSRTDSGSAMPTSPTAPTTTGGTTAGTRPATHTPGAASSTAGPTSPTTQTGPARTPTAAAPATGSASGTATATGPNPATSGPARTPAAHTGTTTGPASTPQSTPASTPRTSPSTPNTPSTSTSSTNARTTGADGRIPGTPDSRPGTTDNRTSDSRTPGSTNPRTPGTADNRTPHQTTPHTTPTGRTPAPNTPERTGTPSPSPTPRQNPSTPSATTQTPGQATPAQSAPARTTPPSTGTPATTPPTNPDRTPTPSGRTATPTSQPSTTTPPASPTPARPPHQPTGNNTSAPGTPGTPTTPTTPRTPNTPQQPAAQSAPPQSTPHPQQQPRDNNQVTAAPIPTPLRTPAPAPAPSASPTQAAPTSPQAPGSPNTGNPATPHHPAQDSLQDIRTDLDHSPGGLTPPDPADQQALTNAVPHDENGTPQRFPDPFGPWTQLQNDGGPTVTGRSNNCADCSRSFLETWYGNPQVSAARTPDTDAGGNPDTWSPEDNANDNQIRWTGATHTYTGPGGDPNTADTIANTLRQAGPGSAAIVQVDWPGGGGHAYNAVNHNGTIIWIDTQSGQVSHQPLHIDQATHVWHIPLNANRNPIDTTQSTQQVSGNASVSGPATQQANQTDPSDESTAHATGPARKPDTAPVLGDASPPIDGTGRSPSDQGPRTDGRTDTEDDAAARPDSNATSRRDDIAQGPQRPAGQDVGHHGGTSDPAGDKDDSKDADDHPYAEPHDRGTSDTSDESRRITDDGPGSDVSRTHETPEGEKSREYGIEPDALQQRLRLEQDVHRVELDRVHDRLDDWAQSGALADVMRTTAGNGPDSASDTPRRFTRERLSTSLPGFRDLSPGEQQAVVASLARLSLSFHQEHAVGRSPEHIPFPYRNEGESDPDKDTPDRGAKLSKESLGVRLHRMAMNALFKRAEFKNLPPEELKEIRRHGPDFSGKNYAVLEVQGPPPDHDIEYIVDSSVPANQNLKGVQPRHSERHLLDWLKRMDPDGTKYTPLGLYTEREPCGEGQGHAKCSDTLRDERLRGIPIHYSTTYRDDPVGVSERGTMADNKREALKQMKGLSDEDTRKVAEEVWRKHYGHDQDGLDKALKKLEGKSGDALRKAIRNEFDAQRKGNTTHTENAISAEFERHITALQETWQKLRTDILS
ncbi:toxin glutamine deamidase domain-containing protein [Streptomyces sp. JW3]|uniref:toxin glutamine deamidase domain-containing protein n=1 Tax=Streptomyces sp. JW3 TaxID=3456955 RepID=UPI003FA4CA7F